MKVKKHIINVRVQGDTIKRVYKAKYLDIVIDDKLTWKDHIDHVSCFSKN